MKERSITVPNSYWVKKSDWTLEATKRNEPAAELIEVFLYHYDFQSENRLLIELIEKAIKKHGRYIKDLDGWMPYTFSYLRELLLFTHGGNQVIEALKVLEELKFISTDIPDDISEFYSKNLTWVKIHVPVIRHWIKTVWFPAKNLNIDAKQIIAEMNKKERSNEGNNEGNKKASKERQAIGGTAGAAEFEADTADAADDIAMAAATAQDENAPKDEPQDSLTKVINTIGNYYKHIHRKKSSYIIDPDRKKVVREHFKQLDKVVGRSRAVALCAQAIVGCTFSDFHQARHPENLLGARNEKGNRGKIYDDIAAHIFKNTKRFERFVEHAEDNGVTEKLALEDVQRFIAGEQSKFIKPEAPPPPSPRAINLLEVEQLSKYKAFAMNVSSLFHGNNVPVKDILDMCDSNFALQHQGAGLTNSNALFDALMEAGRIRYGEVGETMETAMRDFARQYTELQELNQ